MRQMLAAAPRPGRPILGEGRMGDNKKGRRDAHNLLPPLDLWRGEVGRVQLIVGRDGGVRGRAGLPPSTIKALGHAITEETTSEGCGGRMRPLGKGPVELSPHPFWSPHLYPPPLPPHSPVLPPPAAVPVDSEQSPLQPLSFFPLSLSHVANLGRHGGLDRQAWREAVTAEKCRFTHTLSKLEDRAAKISALTAPAVGSFYA